MSRSRRKSPFGGIASGTSEKEGKKRTHRKMRAMERQAWSRGDVEAMPRKGRDAVNPWDMEKDGRQYYDKATLKLYPKLMRK